MYSLMKLVRGEIARQNQLWPDQDKNSQADWIVILTEEVGEVCEATLKSDHDKYVEELTHVAAVAIQMLGRAVGDEVF